MAATIEDVDVDLEDDTKRARLRRALPTVRQELQSKLASANPATVALADLAESLRYEREIVEAAVVTLRHQSRSVDGVSITRTRSEDESIQWEIERDE